MENVAATSGFALVLAGTAFWVLLPIPGVWVGCVIALVASVFYVACEDRGDNHSENEKASACGGRPRCLCFRHWSLSSTSTSHIPRFCRGVYRPLAEFS
jgi:hypothetical protein